MNIDKLTDKQTYHPKTYLPGGGYNLPITFGVGIGQQTLTVEKGLSTGPNTV